MKASKSVLVSKITTIPTVSELGRYVAIVPLGVVNMGEITDFFDRQGRQVCGRVVNMTEDMARGTFPQVSGLVVDTHLSEPERKRMAQGGPLGERGKR